MYMIGAVNKFMYSLYTASTWCRRVCVYALLQASSLLFVHVFACVYVQCAHFMVYVAVCDIHVMQ